MVQLATNTKIKISELAQGCKHEMNRFIIEAYLSILPLVPYDILIGMD